MIENSCVIFDTGPEGKHHINDVTVVRIEPAGEGDKGFARYRISLGG